LKVCWGFVRPIGRLPNTKGYMVLKGFVFESLYSYMHGALPLGGLQFTISTVITKLVALVLLPEVLRLCLTFPPTWCQHSEADSMWRPSMKPIASPSRKHVGTFIEQETTVPFHACFRISPSNSRQGEISAICFHFVHLELVAQAPST
jgi:hypothetical protein